MERKRRQQQLNRNETSWICLFRVYRNKRMNLKHCHSVYTLACDFVYVEIFISFYLYYSSVSLSPSLNRFHSCLLDWFWLCVCAHERAFKIEREWNEEEEETKRITKTATRRHNQMIQDDFLVETKPNILLLFWIGSSSMYCNLEYEYFNQN